MSGVLGLTYIKYIMNKKGTYYYKAPRFLMLVCPEKEISEKHLPEKYLKIKLCCSLSLQVT